jgi:hypothetical protein
MSADRNRNARTNEIVWNRSKVGYTMAFVGFALITIYMTVRPFLALWLH